MKTYLVTLSLIAATVSVAQTTDVGIICRDDKRLEKGSLREIILTPNNGEYFLQYQYVPSLTSSDIKAEPWAWGLKCRIDEKPVLAFCQNAEGTSTVTIVERREAFLDSMEASDKKKTTKHVDIHVSENGVQKNALSFFANQCDVLGPEA